MAAFEWPSTLTACIADNVAGFTRGVSVILRTEAVPHAALSGRSVFGQVVEAARTGLLWRLLVASCGIEDITGLFS